MHIDFDRITEKQNVNEQSDMIQTWIAACEDDDPIYLSDCLVRASGKGGVVLLELGEQEKRSANGFGTPMKWRLLVIRDEWGHVPKPGETVKKINKRSLKRRDGSVIPLGEREAAMNDGSYSKLYEEIVEYPVDEKGCIECTFTDAGYFLSQYGIHGKSNRAITTKKEMSTEPADYPKGGKRHVHYWRFKEVDREQYENLPYRDQSDI